MALISNHQNSEANPLPAKRIPLGKRLSIRMTRVCIIAAVTIGLLISLGQILIDSRDESRRMDQEVNTLIDIVINPATRAAYNIDPVLAQNVVDGLAGSSGVYLASIIIPPDEVLGESRSNVRDAPLRFVNDALFDEQRYYHRKLVLDERPGEQLGELHVYVDTAARGEAFLRRSGIVFLSGIVRACILALVLIAIFFFLLSRPLAKLAEAISAIDPSRPARDRLPPLDNHENDELGKTVDATNNLLQAIQDQTTQRQVAEDEADYLRQFDKLTDLPNRSLYYDRLRQAIKQAKQRKKRVAILHCDVTGFKKINDKYGYSTGDSLLGEFASRLRSTVPGVCTVARVGGDQFGVLVEEPFEINTVVELAQRILQNCRQPIVVSVPLANLQSPADAGGVVLGSNSGSDVVDQLIELECRIGIAVYPDDAYSADDLIQNAERAMTMAKLRGNKHYQFYVAELEQAIRDRQSLEEDLQLALDTEQLFVVYHPQFSASTNRLVGAEALVRWNDKKRGLIPADVFVPLAEESEMIGQLGSLVLNKATKNISEWRAAGLPEITVAINVSAKQLRHGDLQHQVLNRLKELGIPARLLELEITETAIMEDVERARLILKAIRAAGVGLAMDDFGTGHSSLNYLRKLPFNKLKIDQSFVRDTSDSDNSLILRAIIQLGHSLNMTVVAEGIESEDQLQFLRENDCDVVQGFHHSPPLSEADFRALLAAQMS